MKRTRKPESDENIKVVSDQIRKASKKPESKTVQKWTSTGVTLLDLIMGGGIPWGNIINIVGDFSSGKTYLAIEILAHIFIKIFKRSKKLKFYYDDAEGGFSFDTRKMYGFDVIKEAQSRSLSVEQFATRFKKQVDKIKSDEYLIYILDTLDGLPSEAEKLRDGRRQKAMEKSMEDDTEYKEEGSYKVEKPKFLSEFFRLRAAEGKETNMCLIVISQVRDNIGVMFGDKQKRTGGKALDFYASHCLWLAEVEKKRKKGRVTGITVKARLKKSKIATPFRESFIDIVFDYGIDNIKSNINFLYDLKTELGKSKTTDRVKWEGKEYSINELIKHIEKRNLEDKLADKVIEKWNEIEESISSKGRKNKWEN
jgi:RecA/RadA recombinase